MKRNSDSFAKACSDLTGRIATNITLAESIIAAIADGHLTQTSGPMAMSNILKGSAGKQLLSDFLRAWQLSAAHLTAEDVSCMLRAALNSFQLALERSHRVDTVWTGPDVKHSIVRRTEAVVNEIIEEAKQELLVVGYWLVTSTIQVQELIDLLIAKSREGVKIRFIFDPAEREGSIDNFKALNDKWPSDLQDAPREIYTWSKELKKVVSKSGIEYDRKLHAKVIVADRHDALVTSANLTHAGLLQNLEMGFRVEGNMANVVVEHFDLLISEKILEARK